MPDESQNISGLPTQEVYSKGTQVIVVHERTDDGRVLYHEQCWCQEWIPLSSFYKMDEKTFEEELSRHGAKRIAPSALPAMQEPTQN